MTNLDKVRALSWKEDLVLSQSLLLLPATKLAVSIGGVTRAQRILSRLTSICPYRPFSSEANLETAKKIARLVRAAANHGPFRANCLDQSLVLACLLKRHGIDSRVCFGARKEGEKLEAHAWVTCFGHALNEDRGVDQRFSPFATVTTNPIESQ